jgi:hypothetical protein
MNFILSLFLSGILLLPQTISTQADALVVTLKLPKTMKFIQGAPFQLRFTSDNPEVIKIKKEIYTSPSESIKVPIQVRVGEARVKIQGRVSYCPRTEGAECFFKQIDIDIPIRVETAGSRQILADIDL